VISLYQHESTLGVQAFANTKIYYCEFAKRKKLKINFRLYNFLVPGETRRTYSFTLVGLSVCLSVCPSIRVSVCPEVFLITVQYFSLKFCIKLIHNNISRDLFGIFLKIYICPANGVKRVKMGPNLTFLDPRLCRRGPINSAPFVRSSVRSSVRS